MCPRTADQFESIRTDKRKLILDAALILFAKKGYHAASIATIAREAGISKGLIYNYFISKEEILKETFSSGLDSMFELYRFDPENLTPQQFAQLINRTFDFLDDDFAFWKIYFSALMQTDIIGMVQDKLFEILIPMIENFTLFFEKSGYENPGEEARFFGAVLDGLCINYISDPENFPKHYCTNRLKSIYNLPEE